MRLLVTGAAGQLGRSLRDSCPPQHEFVGLDRQALDISRRVDVLAAVAAIKPDAIINAAAYTAVDRAESEPALAQAINASGAGHLAEAAHQQGARMIQISTDYVFDGRQSRPYLPEDAANPLSVYGASKLAGEQAVLDATGGRALVVRTAWVYSRYGSNFVKTMLRLFQQREQLGVVSDQFGSPTSAHSLALALWQQLADGSTQGLSHWANTGAASRLDFAQAIRVAAQGLGLRLQLKELLPTPAADFPLPAARPAYAVLQSSISTLGHPPHWHEELQARMPEIVATPD